MDEATRVYFKNQLTNGQNHIATITADHRYEELAPSERKKVEQLIKDIDKIKVKAAPKKKGKKNGE